MTSKINSRLENETENELPIRDVHLPDSVDWWPIAPGWWLVFLATLFVALLMYKKYKKYKKAYINETVATESSNKTITNALKLLDEINCIDDDKQAIRKLSILLRRTAMSLYGRENVAGIIGTQWLYFLDSTGSTTDFSKGIGQVLTQQPYKKLTHYDRKQVVTITKQWLKDQAKIKSSDENEIDENNLDNNLDNNTKSTKSTKSTKRVSRV